MSIQQNKQIVRRIYDEFINQENYAVLDEIYAPNVIIHDPFVGVTQGIETLRQILDLFNVGFPHHRVLIDNITAEADRVCVLHTHYAAHNGTFMGMPPTGKDIVINGIELFRLRNDKIVEVWRKDEDVSLLMQLGIIPAL